MQSPNQTQLLPTLISTHLEYQCERQQSVLFVVSLHKAKVQKINCKMRQIVRPVLIY